MQPTLPVIQWRTKYAAAYQEDGHMVIRYRFPYSRLREAELLGAFDLAPNDRLPYYETLSSMVERNLAITEYLKNEEVPSILVFEDTFQKQEENGIICIYGILNERVTPITQTLFAADCNALTALDVFLRLTHILRDINKTPTSPVLRYLDMDDVYLTENNKIKLGGFYYAAAEGLPQPTHFLPDAAPIIPGNLKAGEIGNAGTDMQILAQIAWNVFSGLRWDCEHTEESHQIPPRYAPPQLLKVLELGLEGDPANCNTFRKQLLLCRKELAKTDFASLVIPMGKPLQKQYHFTVEPKQATTQVPAENSDIATKQQSDKAP